jgi:hypothetical protein
MDDGYFGYKQNFLKKKPTTINYIITFHPQLHLPYPKELCRSMIFGMIEILKDAKVTWKLLSHKMSKPQRHFILWSSPEIRKDCMKMLKDEIVLTYPFDGKARGGRGAKGPRPNELDLGMSMACHVGFAIVLQKKTNCHHYHSPYHLVICFKVHLVVLFHCKMS